MLIPVTLSSSSSSSGSSSNPTLPSGLAQISHAEIVLVELQGSLEVDSPRPRDRDGKFVGTLALDAASNKPTLLIGNHLLEGKIAALPKPYAILMRNNNNNTPRARSKLTTRTTEAGADEMGADEMDAGLDEREAELDEMEVDRDTEPLTNPDADANADGETSTSAGWTIRGIVKKKIIFSKRPMPVIGKKPQ